MQCASSAPHAERMHLLLRHPGARLGAAHDLAVACLRAAQQQLEPLLVRHASAVLGGRQGRRRRGRAKRRLVGLLRRGALSALGGLLLHRRHSDASRRLRPHAGRQWVDAHREPGVCDELHAQRDGEAAAAPRVTRDVARLRHLRFCVGRGMRHCATALMMCVAVAAAQSWGWAMEPVMVQALFER